MANAQAPLIDDAPTFEGQTILITGGTGSFGRAFTQRLLETSKAQKIIIFSRDEQKHHTMMLANDDKRLRYFVGDIRDKDRLMRALAGVDTLIHSAAMKHVPIAEYNPSEAIRTNIEGASNIIDAAVERGIKRVIALSTDKACSPVNLYGATKLCMEKLFVAANSYAGGSETRFDLVRYGNVVGSAGSVVPLFVKQKQQGKLTLTEPSMTRFWISMERAIDLVLLAYNEGRGGETFIPKLGACTVEDLAEAIAPGVERQVIGIRPGEKMHEMLITEDEARNVVEYDRFYIIRPEYPFWGASERADGKAMPAGFSYLSSNAERLSVEEVRTFLQELGFLS